MVDRGIGRKTGRGFFAFPDSRPHRAGTPPGPASEAAPPMHHPTPERLALQTSRGEQWPARRARRAAGRVRLPDGWTASRFPRHAPFCSRAIDERPGTSWWRYAVESGVESPGWDRWLPRTNAVVAVATMVLLPRAPARAGRSPSPGWTGCCGSGGETPHGRVSQAHLLRRAYAAAMPDRSHVGPVRDSPR